MRNRTKRQLKNATYYTALIIVTLSLTFAGTTAAHIIQNPHHISHGAWSCETGK